MKKILTIGFILAGLFLSHPNLTRAQNTSNPETANPRATPSISASFNPDHLGGHWAFGANYNAFFGDFDLNPRFWLSDNSALDLFLAGRADQNDSLSLSGQAINTPTSFILFGAGWRQNIIAPAKDVYVQAMAQVLYHSNYDETSDVTQDSIIANQDVIAFLGLGYELFVPFWQNISIDGQAGVQGREHWNQQTYTTSGGSTHYAFQYSEINTEVELQGLFSASLHYYF